MKKHEEKITEKRYEGKHPEGKRHEGKHEARGEKEVHKKIESHRGKR